MLLHGEDIDAVIGIRFKGEESSYRSSVTAAPSSRGEEQEPREPQPEGGREGGPGGRA